MVQEMVPQRLTHKMVLEMAGRGSRAFMESAIAVMTSRNVGEIREIFSLQKPKEFVAVMKEAGVTKRQFEAYLEIAKKNRTRLEDASDKNSIH